MRVFLLPVLFLAVVGCDSGSDTPFDVSAYVGTYTGTILLTENGSDAPDPIETPATVVVSASESARTVRIAISSDGTDALVLNGTYDEDGAVFPLTDNGSTVVLRVDGDGDISGSGTTPFFDVTVRLEADGRATSSRFDLTLDFTVTEGNGGTTPTGTSGTVRVEAQK